MVTSLQNFWHKHYRPILMVAMVITAVFMVPHLAHAAPATTEDDTATKLLAGLAQVVSFLQRIFWPILMMIGSLMQNDILFGSGMEQRLLEIWVNIRNIVNILFVLILLAIALMNVVGAAGDDYHFKNLIPKFVIPLIAVNFTFIGMKLVLDSVNIVATAMFALPDSVEQALKESKTTEPRIGMLTVEEINGMCGSIYGADIKTEFAKYQENVNAASAKSQTICAPTESGNPPSYLDQKAVTFFSSMNSKNAAMVMAIALGKANLFNKVYVEAKNATPGKLVINSLFSIVLYVVYGTAFVALFVTLLVRLVVLWVMIAVSPLAVLPMALPEKITSMLGEGGDLGKKFIANAIVPIPVALVMSIGYIMLRGLQVANLSAADKFINNPTLSLDLLTSGITSLQSLLVGLGMVAFVWVGVFTALKGTYAEGIVESIKGGVEGAGKALGSFAVGSIPLFPTTKGQPPVTVGALGVGLQALKNMPHEKSQKEAEAAFSWMRKSGDVGNKMGASKNIEDFKSHAKNTTAADLRNPDIQKGWAEFFEKDGKKYKNTELQSWLNKAGIKDTPDAFIKRLKEGKVDPAELERVYKEAGIPLASLGATPPGDAKTAAQEGKLTPEQNKLLDKKQRDNMVKNGELTPDQVKQLEQIDKDLKDKDPKKVEEAKKQLAKISEDVEKTIKDKENAKVGLEADIGYKINNATRGKDGKNPMSKEEVEAVAQDLGKKVADNPEKRDQIIAAAAKNLSNDQVDALTKGGHVSKGSILELAIQKRGFEASSDFTGKRWTPTLKKASDTAKGTAGAQKAEEAYKTAYDKAMNDWVAKGGTSAGTASTPASPAPAARTPKDQVNIAYRALDKNPANYAGLTAEEQAFLTGGADDAAITADPAKYNNLIASINSKKTKK